MEKEFKVGDMVFLKLQDYRQGSVEHRNTRKLSKRFFGPFEIIERIGSLEYRLQLPTGTKIHNGFHVSLLREAKGNPSPVPLPDFIGIGEPMLQPSQVLDHRYKLGKVEVLVAWKGQDIAEVIGHSRSEKISSDISVSEVEEVLAEMMMKCYGEKGCQKG
ncbi:uncharacterized protein LOC143617240 [Bidens hawaiensis]|uniref:uncharacterized protein LOC143617240 n=1 Tax=Bidens hawaiensis TaxID=980011 RepID=UPI00404A2F69